jgi:hypothetical protein
MRRELSAGKAEALPPGSAPGGGVAVSACRSRRTISPASSHPASRSATGFPSAGNRRSHHALPMMAVTRSATPAPPDACNYERKRLGGKTAKEALRCLKRPLAGLVYHQLVLDWRGTIETCGSPTTVRSNAAYIHLTGQPLQPGHHDATSAGRTPRRSSSRSWTTTSRSGRCLLPDESSRSISAAAVNAEVRVPMCGPCGPCRIGAVGAAEVA